MSSILFSRDWYRLSHLKPQLRRHVEVHVHNYRGERWYVLQNHSTGHFRRLTPFAYLLVGLMDGQRTVEDIWQLSSERLREDLPSHEEVLQLIGNLYQGNLIKMDLSGDAAELFRHGEEQKNKRWLAKLRSPLSIQIPLIDPNAFLERTQQWVKPIFSSGFMLLWLAMVTMLAVLGWRHWDALTSNLSDQILAADNLLLLWFAYPLIKILHELGHAYVIKRAGGDVHEVGIMLLVFFPMPYVDASASSSFANKYQRMVVDAAGMMVELFIASLAMLVWIGAEEGLVRSFAFNILFIAGVSTLLFNGNPLLRFDGYYLLADWLEMPNLSQRSNQYWGYLCKRFLFGLKHLESPALDKKEALILALYGVASLAYRLLISITIVLFVSQQYFFVGVVLAIWSILLVWIWPFAKQIWQALHNQEIIQNGYNPFFVVSGLVALIYVLLMLVPLPQTTTIEGVVLTDEESRLVAPENCFVVEWLRESGDEVKAGEAILNCENMELATELEVTQWQLDEVVARRRGAFNDPVQIKILDEEKAQLDSAIAELKQRQEKLLFSSSIDGMLELPNSRDMQNRWLRRGDELGFVLSGEKLKISAMLPEHQVGLVRNDVQAVTVRSSNDFKTIYSVDEWLIFPASSREVVSPILTVQGGGLISLDPSAENQAIENYFYAEARVSGEIPVFINQRVYLQFQHQAEPIGYRFYRLIRRTFLEYFSV